MAFGTTNFSNVYAGATSSFAPVSLSSSLEGDRLEYSIKPKKKPLEKCVVLESVGIDLLNFKRDLFFSSKILLNFGGKILCNTDLGVKWGGGGEAHYHPHLGCIFGFKRNNCLEC